MRVRALRVRAAGCVLLHCLPTVCHRPAGLSSAKMEVKVAWGKREFMITVGEGDTLGTLKDRIEQETQVRATHWAS